MFAGAEDIEERICQHKHSAENDVDIIGKEPPKNHRDKLKLGREYLGKKQVKPALTSNRSAWQRNKWNREVQEGLQSHDFKQIIAR